MQLLLSQKKELIFSLKKGLVNKFSRITTEHCVAEKYFTLWSQRLHRTMKFKLGDVVLETDSQGKEYLVHSGTLNFY